MPYAETEVDLDLTNDTPESLDEDFALLPAGRYHLRITGVARETNPSPHLRLRCRVLAGPKAGAVTSEKFYTSEEAKKRLKILATRFGLIERGDFGQRRPIDFAALVGRDLVAEVEVEDFTYQKGAKAGKSGQINKWSFAGFWPADDPRVADVPKGHAPPHRPANGQARPAPAPAPAPRQQQVPMPPAAGAYDDI